MTLHAHTTLSNTTATRLTPNGLHSGYRIAPGAAFSIELPGQDALYAISTVNSSKVAILQTGLEG